VVHPGAAAVERRWSVDGFASVAGWLLGLGLAVVATGVEAEHDLVDRLRRRQPAVVDLCGRTSITDLAGVLSRARLVVSNNTGVAHLAAAVRAPSVVVFLGEDPGRWAPLDSARHRVVPLSHHPQDIDGELAAVLEAVAQQLNRFPT
jgi:ADP-heptose:LPS heptosyltransferase